jgi:hypothetical protein
LTATGAVHAGAAVALSRPAAAPPTLESTMSPSDPLDRQACLTPSEAEEALRALDPWLHLSVSRRCSKMAAMASLSRRAVGPTAGECEEAFAALDEEIR